MSNLKTCLSFFSAFEDGNVERMVSLCAPDAAVHFEPFGDSFSGSVEGIGKIVWGAFVESFPDLKVDLQDIRWDNTGTMAYCQVRVKGTQLYPFIGIHQTGHNLKITQHFHLVFDEMTNINIIRVRWNHDEFVQQLGPTGEGL